MVAAPTPEEPPPLVRARLGELAAPAVRAEVTVHELPAPTRLAPWAHALAVQIGEDAVARLVYLHDPAGQAGWEGTERLVAYLRVTVDPDMAADPLLPEVAWSCLTASLRHRGAAAVAEAGTVTVTSQHRFGALAGLPGGHEVQLRCSWSPVGADLGAHVAAVADTLAALAGLPPEGVTPLPVRPVG